MKKKTFEFFSCIPGFRKLPIDELAAAAQEITQKKYKKGEILFREGETASYIWVVERGRVDLTHAGRSGQTVTSHVAVRGDIFCGLSVLDEKAYPATALCALHSDLLRFPLQRFTRLSLIHPQVYRDISAYFCGRFRSIQRRFASLFDTSEKKIANVLLDMQRKFGSEIPLTRIEIAQLALTATETAIRVMCEFDRAGITGSRRGLIRLRDTPRLKQLLEK